MTYNFQLQKIQTALFTPGINLAKPLDVAQNFINFTESLFDGQPVILPIPPDAPPEIPRIILKNSNDSYSCNISQNRVDFIFTEKGTPRSLSDEKDIFLRYLLLNVELLKNKQKVSINRVGTAITFLLPLLESSNKFINEKFLKERLFTDVYEVQFGVLKRLKLSNYEINCWFKLNTLRNTEDPSDDKAASVTFDINTRPDIYYDLNVEQVTMFYKSALSHIEENIKIYFLE